MCAEAFLWILISLILIGLALSIVGIVRNMKRDEIISKNEEQVRRYSNIVSKKNTTSRNNFTDSSPVGSSYLFENDPDFSSDSGGDCGGGDD